MLRKKKRTWILFTILIVLGVAFLLRDKLKQNSPRISIKEVGTDMYALEEAVRNVLGQECVAIATNRSRGSGILFSYDGEELLVLTAGHLMQNFESGELELWSGEKLEFTRKDVQLFEEYDGALIRLVTSKLLKQQTGGVREYVSEAQLAIGETMWVVDSAYGPASGIHQYQVYAVDFYLDDYGTEMLLLSGEGVTGMSGCGVYDETGKIVAMMSGMSEDGSVLAAVPVEIFGGIH